MSDGGNPREWIAEYIPDLEQRMNAFAVEAMEMDEELKEAFCSELALQSGELEAGLRDNDHERIRRAAHSIKGMGGTIGLPEISVLAEEIGSCVKEGREERCAELARAFIQWSRNYTGQGS
ncbi:Hpt domain-containing protein [Kiritimatiella glycovorans]|uniref:HPt domain-containing protein n=1 Tax=Kiritimatiella glycovorans TaxID=1307763 RepID=A0A0G3EDW4_9BACT|nr:Hpt domain-containing protein [Kiritimatiella glycovorans]AKJ64498.1 hypothetical protein L21SP4_01250 [Kiritimatiella glycovorans]